MWETKIEMKPPRGGAGSDGWRDTLKDRGQRERMTAENKSRVKWQRKRESKVTDRQTGSLREGKKGGRGGMGHSNYMRARSPHTHTHTLTAENSS